MSAVPTLGEELAKIKSSAQTPRLMLHCCCAPCASYVLEYLSPYFKITALYYNPNITPFEEYAKRAAEFQKLPLTDGYPNHIDFVLCGYDAAGYDSVASPFFDEPEGGLRCRECFKLRLEETARRASEGGYDYFTTTLSVSPHKDARILNEIGGALAAKYGVSYLHSDFKKAEGFKRSIELSGQYGLYRQDYCGCRPFTGVQK